MNEYKISISMLLAGYANASGYKKHHIAKEIGIDKTTLSYIIHLKREFSDDLYCRINSYLNQKLQKS